MENDMQIIIAIMQNNVNLIIIMSASLSTEKHAHTVSNHFKTWDVS